MISSVTTRPSDARQNMRLCDECESRCAVHSSALSDGKVSLHFCSADTVAAYLSIGMTEQDHRHSGVVHVARHVRGHRQDSVRSVVLLLHQVLVGLRRSSVFKALRSSGH
jgi:hypothetical protein